MKSLRILALIIAFLSFTTAQAQLNIGEKIKQKAKDRLEQKTDQGIDKGLDKTEEGVGKAAKGKKGDKKSGDKESDKKDESSGDSKKEEVKSSSKGQEEGLKSYTKYDFVPGDKILFFDDFSQDAIGDFPARWTTNGSGEVRTLNKFPGNWLYMNAKDRVYLPMVDLNLPENYILEFDVILTRGEDAQSNSFYITMFDRNDAEFMDDGLVPATAGFHVTLKESGWEAQGYKDGSYTQDGASELAPVEEGPVNHVIIWVQKQRLRVYHKGQKVMDLPSLIPAGLKSNRLRFSLWGQESLPYITNVRITTAAPDTRSKLITEGKLISYGIYFDVNSDKVKPESNGALNDIAKVLKENPTVNIKIVGHTDSDGDDAKNMDLSKRRAGSVKSALEKEYGIDGSRMQTDGKGESEPIAPNDKAENKSKNRRVEFLKL